MNRKKTEILSIAFIAVLCLTASCSNKAQKAPVDQIDLEESAPTEEYGIKATDDTHGTIYVNASDYKQWQYINIQDGKIISGNVGEAAPEKWDFAVHRFDVKTNGGSAFETELTDLSKISEIGEISQDKFINDIDTSDKVIVDMSGMMQGKVKYAEDKYNPCLSRWMDMNMKNMPPEFNLSDKVYLLRLSNGKTVALHFTNYVNKSDELGYLTIEYNYKAI